MKPSDVTVYTLPNCQACKMTQNLLESEGVLFITRTLLDTENEAYVKKLGHLQAPVVVVGDEHWSGFVPDRIKQVAARINGEQT